MAGSRTSSPKIEVHAAMAEPVRYGLRFGDFEYEVSEQDVVIGRGDDCDVVVDESQVSRRHARLFVDGGEPFIEDLGSANGTFVNHARLHGRARLFSGDIVFIGSCEFELTDGATVDRPTMPAPEPASAMLSSNLGLDAPPPSSRPVPRHRSPALGVASLRATESGTADGSTRALEHAGRLADKMFAMGRVEAALKILTEPLEGAIEAARLGQIPSGALIDVAGRYAVKLAAETLDGKWIDLAIELHDLSVRVLRDETMQQLAALRARAPLGANALIERYVNTLRENAASMGGAERILCERLMCLLPANDAPA